MPYYVLGPGGAKHGPVELPLLRQWVSEGRVAAETLIEDSGGVKLPARAIKGLQFASQPTSIGASPSLPTSMGGAPIHQQTPAPILSTYTRLGGTAGNDQNLFVPGIDAKWAAQGLTAAAISIGLGVLCLVSPFELFRVIYFALGSSIYGVMRGMAGHKLGERGRASLIITLNTITFFAVIGLIVWKFIR